MADMLDKILTGLENLFSLPAGEILPTLLPGLSAMANLHPLFVHFPIALLTVFFFADLTASIFQKPDWRKAADWFLYLGAVFAVMTMIAGLHAAETVPHTEDVHEIMETHEHLGIAIVTIALSLSVWRLIAKPRLKGMANTAYLILAAGMWLMLVFAADLGGLMVYHFGVAVTNGSAADTEEQSPHHHHDHEL
jgi:uncharacterized membrane protein